VTVKQSAATTPAVAPVSDPLLTALDAHVRALVAVEVERLLADLRDWIDQSRSPLGRKAHLALAKTGKVKASKIGKQVLIWRADLNAHIAAHPVKIRLAEPDNEEDEIGRLLKESGFTK